MTRKVGCVVAGIALATLAGCASLFPEHTWYGNRRALDSTLERPVLGGPEASTFVDPSAKGRVFRSVVVRPVVVSSTRREDPQEHDLLASLSRTVENALYDRATASERFGAVLGPNELGAEAVLSGEVRIHISTLDGRVMPDPVLNDPRSKIFAVYTLRDAADGRVLVRFTSVQRSQWEYAPSVMAEMEVLALATVRDLEFVLTEM